MDKQQNLLNAIQTCIINAQHLNDSITELLQNRCLIIKYVIGVFIFVVIFLYYALFYKTKSLVLDVMPITNDNKNKSIISTQNPDNLDAKIIKQNSLLNTKKQMGTVKYSFSEPEFKCNKAALYGSTSYKSKEIFIPKYFLDNYNIKPDKITPLKYTDTIYAITRHSNQFLINMKKDKTNETENFNLIENASTPKKKVSMFSKNFDASNKKVINTENILLELDDSDFDVTNSLTMTSNSNDKNNDFNTNKLMIQEDFKKQIRKCALKNKKAKENICKNENNHKSKGNVVLEVNQHQIQKENKRLNCLNSLDENLVNNNTSYVQQLSTFNNNISLNMVPKNIMNQINQKNLIDTSYQKNFKNQMNVINHSPPITSILSSSSIPTYIKSYPVMASMTPLTPLTPISPVSSISSVQNIQFHEFNDGYKNNPLIPNSLFDKSIWNDFSNSFNKNWYS